MTSGKHMYITKNLKHLLGTPITCLRNNTLVIPDLLSFCVGSQNIQYHHVTVC